MDDPPTRDAVPKDRLTTEAKSLLEYIVNNTDEKYGFGTLSCAVYDTAWVALVTKLNNGRKCWLFPESFQYILDNQAKNGAWSDDTGIQIDGVLNTMAGLLALKRHQAEPLQIAVDHQDLHRRIDLAVSALRLRLDAWDVSTTNHVGFELVVPSMLELLEREDPSLLFDFEGKKELMAIYHAKMARFKPEMLYDGKIISLTHSLDGLTGKIDFDKVGRFKVMGSMFASGASTAAYLINTSTWDDEAEDYLRHAIKSSVGHGDGSVPGVFPTTTFEYTWVLSTLLRAGFTISDLACPALDRMRSTVLDIFDRANAIVGLAPGIEPDVDDSAKIVTTLNMLGVPTSTRRLCEVFETPSHFRVYPGERDPSVSANCNALAALLSQPDARSYSKQIKKTATFLCDKQWTTDQKNADKWNVSHLYPSFLYFEAMVDLVSMVEKGSLSGVFEDAFLVKVCLTLFQSCTRAMSDQETDGSWNHSVEETSYAVLLLAEACKLVFVQDLKEQVRSSIQRGIDFLEATGLHSVQYLWTDKVSYGSLTLTKGYMLGALKAASDLSGDGNIGSSIWSQRALDNLAQGLKLFRRTQLLETLSEWEFTSSMIEAVLYQPLLRDCDLEIFPGDIAIKSYRAIIPFAWVVCINRRRAHASASFMWEMMVVSFFTYQLDEFIEGQVGTTFEGRTNDLHQLIDQVMAGDHEEEVVLTNGNGQLQGTDTRHFRLKLSQAVSFILDNTIVRSASEQDRNTLRQELGILLHAHATQLHDSTHVNNESVSNHAESFFRWVRGTSADHIAAPFCFSFLACQMSATLTPRTNNECFPTAMESYLAAVTCGHLSSMARMYNDLGSWARDRQEGNLSCIHFLGSRDTRSDESRKSALFHVAQYERSRWMDALTQLEREMQRAAPDAAAKRLAGRRARLVEVFCDATDLWGQVYVLKDFTDPIKAEVRNGDHVSASASAISC